MAGRKHSESLSYPVAEGCKASGMRVLLIWVLSCAYQKKSAAQRSDLLCITRRTIRER